MLLADEAPEMRENERETFMNGLSDASQVHGLTMPAFSKS